MLEQPTTPKSPIALPLFQSNEPQVCFDRTQFNNADFSVERFIYLSRKRATLQQIHGDLRAFLRQIQNSMVELINDDYADFVNLSSNLATLKESIDKVTGDIRSSWDAFGASTSNIQKTAEFLEQKTSEISESRNRQIAVRNKLALLSAIDKFSECLSRAPSDLSVKWYVKLMQSIATVELWQSKIPEIEVPPQIVVVKEACLVKCRKILLNDLVEDLRGECQCIGLILAVLEITGQTDAAIENVANVIVKNSMDFNIADEFQRLKEIYDRVLKMRKRWFQHCQMQNQLTNDVETFLESGLLRFVLNHLDERIATLCMPTDPPHFFKSYNLTLDFALRFPNISSHSDFLRGLSERFNAVVYAKRITVPMNEELLAKTANSRVVWNDQLTERRHPLDVADVVLKGISHLFSDEVFLPVVADRIWEFCLQMINRHSEWLDYCADAEPIKVVDELSGSVTVIEKWPDVVALVAGSQSFDAALFDLCIKRVFKRFEELGADVDPFRHFIGGHNELMEQKRSSLRSRLSDLLFEMSQKRLVGVTEIPKQYRWTKKPSPTEPSAYLNETFDVHKKFISFAVAKSWNVDGIKEVDSQLLVKILDEFLKNARQVLSSVQLTGSSLQRFKRKAQMNSDGTTAESDESKIRKQLVLDSEAMRTYASSYGIAAVALDELLKDLQKEEST